MVLSVENYVDTLKAEEIVNQATNDVYRDYSRFARLVGSRAQPKIPFSREVCRAFGLCTKARRINGELTRFYVRKDD